jgi:hypothetical protein
VKKHLFVLLAGLWLGALAACGEVTLGEQSRGEPALVDPETHTPFCLECPMPYGLQVAAMSMSRKPVADGETGELKCLPCGGELSFCGDGMCNGGETCGSCSTDCGVCPPPASYCGDGTCNGGETSASCPSDCGSPAGPVLGQIARYCGKVNNHREPGGSWTWDSDCTSGCNIGGLSYCQKFWPASISIRQVSVSSKPSNVWANRGCAQVDDDWDGGDEFECVGAPTVLGRIARYCGKVNNHQTPGGSWTWDSDCTSGCNIGGLSYCQKFWPGSTSIRQIAVSSKPDNVWANAGCAPVADDWDGGDEFECVAD